MFQQVIDFRDESLALYEVLKPLSADAFDTTTQFKQWSFNDILGHLHMWNWAADLSLKDETALLAFMHEVFQSAGPGGLRPFEKNWRNDLAGPELLETWQQFVLQMSDHFADADPKTRVKWAGPDMSVRSSITARLMETWAHGQAIYDALGLMRQDGDRIKNIAVLGVKTFGWTFKNRQLPVPDNAPYIKLRAPSGDIWEWHEPDDTNKVSGSATQFCQVVTQTRHIDDTDLTVIGDTARLWMSMAQCFAGPPENPPAAGSRHRITT